MKYINYSVNETGMQEIRNFLINNHKNAEIFSLPCADDMLNAWAEDAERSIEEGNGAEIELSQFNSIHRRTQTLQISPAGLDATEVEINE